MRLHKDLLVAAAVLLLVGCPQTGPASTSPPAAQPKSPPAVLDDQVRILRETLATYPDGKLPPEERSSLLATAIKRNRADLLKELIKGGVDLKAPLIIHEGNSEPMTTTPVMYAVIVGASTETVTTLVSLGADVNAPSSGAFPLHQAACYARYDLAGQLISAGARVDQADPIAGFTLPMEMAMCTEEDQTARALELLRRVVRDGADVNAKGARGATALGFAVLKGNLAFVKGLLELGANPGVRTESGETLIEVARRKQFPEIESALKAAIDASSH